MVTVRELIRQLRECDPGAKVVVFAYDENDGCLSVEARPGQGMFIGILDCTPLSDEEELIPEDEG